jgi:hypothetical protein
MMVAMGHFVRLSTSTRMWPFWVATVLFRAPNALADDFTSQAAAEIGGRPPAPQSYLQYGVAFTVEGVASAGPICPDASSPCILGSGGGVSIRVGWRPNPNLYIGGAYEFSKQDPSKLYRLGILQQARTEIRQYFATGQSIVPFAVIGAGLAGYGDEWNIDSWGPAGTVGGGIEIELSDRSLLGLEIAYRPIYLHSFVDSSLLSHQSGVAHLIGIDLALEALDAL